MTVLKRTKTNDFSGNAQEEEEMRRFLREERLHI
jgi:hypothetical protein